MSDTHQKETRSVADAIEDGLTAWEKNLPYRLSALLDEYALTRKHLTDAGSIDDRLSAWEKDLPRRLAMLLEQKSMARH